MKAYQKALCFLVLLAMSAALAACGPRADYSSAESFVSALRDGKDVEGKTVRFVVKDVFSGADWIYNIQAGENLYFISNTDPQVEKGDTVTVRVNATVNLFGKWLIDYEPLSGKEGESSGSAAPEETGGTEDGSAAAPQPLELTDYGFVVDSGFGDMDYVDFCGMVYNPNEAYAATFPEVLVTVKDGDGAVLATDSQTGSLVMPGDTVTICGRFSLPSANVTEGTMIYFNVEWSDMRTDTFLYSGARTTDFAITNVSDQSSGGKGLITGEITNNYSEDVSSVRLAVILRKDGKIVYIDDTYMSNLMAGRAKAFEISSYGGWPEYDTIDISAMAQ